MTVERTHAGHQTRYELRDGAALVCALTPVWMAQPLAAEVDAPRTGQ
jgi:hypothetical protein